MYSVQFWFTTNYVKLSISKSNVISFSRKTNIVIYAYELYQLSRIRTDSIKDLAVL
jgi:hypothetical protein